MSKKWIGALALSASVAVTALGGCNFGGLNDNVHNAGDEPGGVKIALGDIAVAPSGDYFVFEREGKLAIGWVGSGKVDVLPIVSPSRLAFAKQRRFVYVTTTSGKLHGVDVDARAVAWSAAAAAGDAMVVSSQGDTRIAVGAGRDLGLFDAGDGHQIAGLSLDQPLRDLEVLPDDQRLLAVESHEWLDDAPSTTVHVVDLEAGAAHAFEVPNCSDDVIVPKHGKLALLAPTGCSKDPISYLDLTPGAEQFVKNLPGFGPVALGPDGATAVGFLDSSNIDETLFDDPNAIPGSDTRYHLMVIDTESLGYQFYAWGQKLPRYAMTPDGSVLLVDEAYAPGSARLFDLLDRQFETIEGPAVSFEHLAFSGDSQHAFLLSDAVVHASTSSQQAWTDYQLFDLDVAAASVSLLPTAFRPRNVNVAPGADRLFLRRDATTICVYSLATMTCERDVDLVVQQ